MPSLFASIYLHPSFGNIHLFVPCLPPSFHSCWIRILSFRYRDREDNRKDVYRILHELVDEAKKADELVAVARDEALQKASG